MGNKARFSLTVLGFFLLAYTPSTGGSPNEHHDATVPRTPVHKQSNNNNGMVYVCACLKNKSCSCMTEAKMEGPCACGTKGGPPLKAVPKDSDWAKANRDALAN